MNIYTVMNKENLQELREKLGDVERVLKAMIKSLENKHLNPGLLEPVLPNNFHVRGGHNEGSKYGLVKAIFI